jgi:hypothetical protein
MLCFSGGSRQNLGLNGARAKLAKKALLLFFSRMKMKALLLLLLCKQQEEGACR